MNNKINKCKQKCEIFSRVCGYFRPITNWNKGKREEFKDRKLFQVGKVTILMFLFFLSCSCSHNAINYGSGFRLQTTIDPQSYALGVSLLYGKILSVCVRENTIIILEDGAETNGNENNAAANKTLLKIKIGPQYTGYYVDALKAGEENSSKKMDQNSLK